MKRLLIIVLILFPLSLFSQPVKRGYIVEDLYPLSFVNISSHFREPYMPSINDLNKAETIVKNNKDVIKAAPNYHAGRHCGIFPVYSKYFKQYVGFKNDKNEKLIAINYIYRKSIKSKDVSKLISILDGGNKYWQAIVNIDTGQLVEIAINGEG